MAPKEALKCSRQIIPIYESPIIFIYIIPTLKSCISSKVLQLRDMPQGIKSNKQNKGEKMYTHIQHRAPQPLGLSHAGGGRDNPAALLTPSTSSRVCACAEMNPCTCHGWGTCVALQCLSAFCLSWLFPQIRNWLVLRAQECHNETNSLTRALRGV